MLILELKMEQGKGHRWIVGELQDLLPSFRSNEHVNAYENVLEEEGKVRSTPM